MKDERDFFESPFHPLRKRKTTLNSKKMTATKANTSKSTTAKTNTAKSDAAKVDTAKSDAAKVDTAKVDTAKVDTAEVDTAEATIAEEYVPESKEAREERLAWLDMELKFSGNETALLAVKFSKRMGITPAEVKRNLHGYTVVTNHLRKEGIVAKSTGGLAKGVASATMKLEAEVKTLPEDIKKFKGSFTTIVEFAKAEKALGRISKNLNKSLLLRPEFSGKMA